jgi:hypothetical protein
LFYPKEWRNAIERFVKEEAIMRVMGGIVFMLGLAIWHTVTYSTTKWEEVMAVFGYFILIVSIFTIYHPKGAGKAICGLIKGSLWKVYIFIIINLLLALGLLGLGLFIY